MSFSYYDPNERYRKRAAGQFSSFLMAFIVLASIFGVGFWFGGENAVQEEKILAARVAVLEKERAAIEQELVEVRSTAQTATARYEQLRETYEEELPEGAVQELLSLVRKQLEEGRSPERLAFLIRSARPPRNCSETKSKRFIVGTPANQGPQSKVSIGDGAVLIKGDGVSARNKNGSPEAWYNPGRAVALEFTSLEGNKETKKGTLPLHHSMVVGNREHRFTISEGARSFAKVTFDSCDYP